MQDCIGVTYPGVYKPLLYAILTSFVGVSLLLFLYFTETYGWLTDQGPNAIENLTVNLQLFIQISWPI